MNSYKNLIRSAMIAVMIPVVLGALNWIKFGRVHPEIGPVNEFGTAVDTNHWFKVNDLGYYVLVRTNVWPVQRRWIDRSPPTPLTNYDTGTPMVTYPNAVYLGKWKIFALHGGTNSLYIESIRNPSIVFTFHDFERGGGL